MDLLSRMLCRDYHRLATDVGLASWPASIALNLWTLARKRSTISTGDICAPAREEHYGLFSTEIGFVPHICLSRRRCSGPTTSCMVLSAGRNESLVGVTPARVLTELFG